MRAAVLLYHRVAETPVDSWRMAVSPVRFAEHVELIASRFRALHLGDLVAAAREQRVPASSVAVTFDDGYRDNLYAAKPLLERNGVPATVFVVTGYVDSGTDFWWDALERLRAVTGQAEPEYRTLHRTLQALAHEERLAALQELADELDAPFEREGTTISASELARLAEGGLVEIGAHTVTHPDLRNLGAAEQLDEMRSSKEQLEEWLGRPVTGFAYPYGGVGAESAAAVRTAGFSYACASAHGAVGPETDAFAVPRLHVADWTAEELERRISEALRAG
jgi:peptidoglycan/xylan/chitin deacetylase (PgdA/CDA1 family)